MVGQQLGGEAAEGGVEGGAAAGRVGEERAAAGLEVVAQGLEVLLGEREGAAAVDVDQRVVDQVGVAGEEVLLVRTTLKLNGGLRRASMRLGIAWGAMFQSPACISLAIRSAPAWAPRRC